MTNLSIKSFLIILLIKACFRISDTLRIRVPGLEMMLLAMDLILSSWDRTLGVLLLPRSSSSLMITPSFEMVSLATWHSMCLRSLNLGLTGFGRKSLSVAHPAPSPSLSMLSLDFGVLWGEERSRDRELGFSVSGVLLTSSWVAMAGAWEPDLAGGVGPVFTVFASEGVGGLEVRFLSFTSSVTFLLFLFGAMGNT